MNEAKTRSRTGEFQEANAFANTAASLAGMKVSGGPIIPGNFQDGPFANRFTDRAEQERFDGGTDRLITLAGEVADKA